MPVKFRGVSEYSSTFKWQPSYRSAEFQPTPQQLHPEAGLRSDQLNLLIEPSFMHKKQVPHRRPEAGSCLMWFLDDDFDESEQRDNEVCSRTFVKTGKNNVKKDSIKADKENKPVSKPLKNAETVDSKSTWEKDAQSEYIQRVREEIESSAKALAAKKKTSTKKKKMSAQKEKQSSPAKKSATTTPNKPKLQSPVKTTKQKFAVKTTKQKSPVKEEKQKSPVKESSRSAGTPLRYRPLHHRMLSRHQTEYQHMYKKHSQFVPSSPLISALDVVHSHSPAIPPHKSPKMFAKSEYAAKFKPQSPLSKSVPVFSSPPSPSLRMKVRDLTGSPYSQRHSPKKIESEYADKYPARGFPSDVSMRVVDEAKHNKLNRDGTAFDKDHMNQICSPTNKCWEMSSVSASSDATNTASKVSASKSSDADAQDETKADAPTEENEVEDDDVESIIERDSLDTRSVDTGSTLNQPMPVARKLAWGEEEDESTIQGSEADQKSDSSIPNEGRLPTPQLHDIGGALRTHHDLTTPSRGGALLTSPSRSDKSKRVAQSPAIKQAIDEDLDETPVKLSKTLPSRKEIDPTVIERPVAVSHTLPTPVRNEKKSPKQKSAEPTPGPSDTPKIAKSRKPDVPRFLQPSVRVPIQGALRSQEFQHCGSKTRPSTDFDRISVASAASVASADDLLQRSLQRQDFWKTK